MDTLKAILKISAKAPAGGGKKKKKGKKGRSKSAKGKGGKKKKKKKVRRSWWKDCGVVNAPVIIFPVWCLLSPCFPLGMFLIVFRATSGSICPIG